MLVAAALAIPAGAVAYYDGAGAGRSVPATELPPAWKVAQHRGVPADHPADALAADAELPSAWKVAQHRGVPADRLADPLPSADTGQPDTPASGNGGNPALVLAAGVALLGLIALGVAGTSRTRGRRTARSGA